MNFPYHVSDQDDTQCQSFNYYRRMYSLMSASETSRFEAEVETAVSVVYSSSGYCGSQAGASLEGRVKFKEGGTGAGSEMFVGLIDTKRTI